MAILDYMAYDEVRTTCGLASDELSDTVLALPVYDSALKLAAGDVTVPEAIGTGTLIAEFALVLAKAEIDRTALEQRFYDLCHMFFVYAVAAEVVKPISMRAPKTRSDGKAVITRFSSEATFLETYRNIIKQFVWIKQLIENLPDDPDVVVPSLYVVSPAVDPVTNE